MSLVDFRLKKYACKLKDLSLSELVEKEKEAQEILKYAYSVRRIVYVAKLALIRTEILARETP